VNCFDGLQAASAPPDPKASKDQHDKAAEHDGRSADDMERGCFVHDKAQKPVDFLGGFSLSTSFDPHKDV